MLFDKNPKAHHLKNRRAQQGCINNATGRHAENIVCKDYKRRGHVIEAKRWRGQRGEIDIIAKTDSKIIFIEVKRARNFAHAAERLVKAQQRRIYNTGAEYMATQPEIYQHNVRFDVALVNSRNEIQLIENAIGF